jgi:CII-binding regulator of phage lambda lysogenization HflD
MERKMHKGLEVIVLTLKDNEKEFQEAIEQLNSAMMEYEDKIQKEYNCSEQAASDIAYLRTRSRWSQELEDLIVKLDKEGKHPPVLAGWNGEPEEEWDN